jgi:two-component system, NtrC family, sensor kinase
MGLGTLLKGRFQQCPHPKARMCNNDPPCLGRPTVGFTNLRTAIVAFVVLPCLLAMGLIGWVGLRGLEEQVNVRMQEDLELIARTLRLPLSQALAQGQPAVIQETIESTVGMDQVYAVYVYDEDGQQVASSGRPLAAVPMAQAAELAVRRVRQEGSADIGKDKLVSVFQPLTAEGGRIAGLLQVTRHSGDVQFYLDRVRWLALLGIGAVGLLFTGVIVLGHHFGIGRHLLRLQDGMRRIRDGDLEHRLEEGGAAEFRHLAQGINSMLDGITASQRELELQRRTEQALRERLHRAEKMAAIGRLAAGIAHELGSPLSTLYGRAQQLLRHAPPGSPERAGLLAISESSVRMEQTIRQLMDFGRSNPLNLTDVELDPLLHRLAADARARADAGRDGCRIEIENADGIATIRADALRIEQALRNLLENAVHAARSCVRIGVNGDEHTVRISVGDDGPGVPAEARQFIFDPFFTTKPVGEGTGLGLSVATAAADDHGGSLAFEQDPLGGARFTLSLPREARDDPA